MRNEQSLYDDVYEIYHSPSIYQEYIKVHKRPDTKLITANRDGKLYAPADYVGTLVEKLQLGNFTDISLNEPFCHSDEIIGSQRARAHRNYVTMFEVARDLLVLDRSVYREAIKTQGVVFHR